MFRYETRVMPPAPFVKTQVINPLTGETSHLPGKLDTGAAMTVIPEDIVFALHLEQMGDVLNHFILTLNGKNLSFELKDP